MKFNFNRIWPHVLVFVLFVTISLVYFYPVLKGKKMMQHDISQYSGMARQADDVKEEQGKEIFWTDAAFGGMPTYVIGANYPNNFIQKLDWKIRFLPRPADYLLLYFIGMYILLLVLKMRWHTAFLGALAFGFSTYLIIILGVGHNSKAHAIAFLPVILASVLLTFRRRYLWGGLLLAISTALEVNTNHFQMTYYLMLLILILGVVYLIDAFQKKILAHFFKAVGVMIVALIIGVAANATGFLALQQYSEYSTRGESDLELAQTDSNNKSGLDYDYITSYSYGIAESLNLFIPDFTGGGSGEAKLDKDSETYQALIKKGAQPQQALRITEQLPTYWGDQPYVAGPAYIGATVIFLFVLGLFLTRGKFKQWIVAGSILVLLLSWGKNFPPLSHLFIDYFPFYDKFRSVSSIQVILELCVPLMGFMGLYQLFQDRRSKQEKFHALKWSSIICGGVAVFFILFKSAFFEFEGARDAQIGQQLGADVMQALSDDRGSLLTSSALRSLILIAIVALLSYLYLNKKLNRHALIACLAVVILFDLVGIDKRYAGADKFKNPSETRQVFKANRADKQIMQDKGHYRVLDLSTDPFNSARASYFHNSIGGYSGAKPRRMQELYSHHISQGNREVLNMLNTKYRIQKGENGVQAVKNSDANGNAWFVQNVDLKEDATAVFNGLENFDSEKTALINAKEFSDQIQQTDYSSASGSIKLTDYFPEKLTYEYSTDEDRLAVFSEVFYEYGWKAYVDGEEIPVMRADFTLRAAELPAGQHDLVFKFEPDVLKTGSALMIGSGSIILIVLVLGIVIEIRKKRRETETNPS